MGRAVGISSRRAQAAQGLEVSAGDNYFASLKDFQRDTVAYVLRRLYDDEGDTTDRFLVADEVGMGKTLVARGVIAGAIERMQTMDHVQRIDVIYICSNADIARQNISKLRVGDGDSQALSTRLTLLATQLKDLNRVAPDGGKTINLVAFTPGTSFDQGTSGGRAEERALLWWLLQPVLDMSGRPRRDRNALSRLLQMNVGDRRWTYETGRLLAPGSEPDSDVARKFRKAARASPIVARLDALVLQIAGTNRKLTAEQSRELAVVVGELRHLLARVSVDCLEPDLVILDEFQRFKHLLERPDSDSDREVNQLAHELFTVETAKVLLLSATPYRMFTLAEERDLTGDDHYADFLATVDFLEYPRHTDAVVRLKTALAAFRSRTVSGDDPVAAKGEVEQLLRRVMCRTERPVSGIADMMIEREGVTAAPTPADLVGFAAMRRIAAEVGGSLSIEYWKSAPYFLNFMDGYQLSVKFRDHPLNYYDRKTLLRNAQIIRTEDLANGGDIDAGNARLRALTADTIDRGLWRLLWLPPSLPYYQPLGVYADIDPALTTKRLIFSSWAAAPTAIASLLSWSAAHKMAGARAGSNDGPTRARLVYRTDSGRPAGMTTLALFVPNPALAAVTDPLSVARRRPDRIISAHSALADAEERLAGLFDPPGPASAALSRDTWYWAAPFQVGDITDHASLLDAMGDGDQTDDSGLALHLQVADQAAVRGVELGAQPDDLTHWVAVIGIAAPGNIAWRTIRRVTSEAPGITDDGRRRASVIIAAGFRSLFNRPEVIAMFDEQSSPGAPYWQTVLEYCLSGNLQAVLDEYLHHLVGNENPSSDDALVAMAVRIRTVLSLRTGALQAFNPASPSKPLRFPTRFALRYGSAKGTVKGDDASLERMSDVQSAFNSPFWPMVLASTSIGQEGVDFHWWCHSLVHWNLPANPVDFEQREGRVNRFKGHAVRKNVAAAHRQDALRSDLDDPWIAAFDAAEAGRGDDMNDLWPWWVFPGAAKVERWIPSMPLSRERDRERSLQRQRALYRLAFGQPRQEDLLAILDQRELSATEIDGLRIDLRPPSSRRGTPVAEAPLRKRSPTLSQAPSKPA